MKDSFENTEQDFSKTNLILLIFNLNQPKLNLSHVSWGKLLSSNIKIKDEKEMKFFIIKIVNFDFKFLIIIFFTISDYWDQ